MDPVERAAKRLRSAVSSDAAAPIPPLPDALITQVRTSVTGVRRRRFLTRRVGPLIAAGIAAVVAGTLSWKLLHTSAPSGGELSVFSFEGAVVLTPSQGAAVPLTPGMAVNEGATVTTHAGGDAQLTLQSGGELELFESTELYVQAHGRLVVREGGTRLHLKPQPAGRRFVVATEDTEIEVKGTRLEVEVRQVDAACDVATATRVHIDEGTVWVKHGSDQIVLNAGDSWPICGAAVAPSKPAPAEGAGAPAAALAPSPSAAHEPTLAEQNAKYREAIAARKRGDLPGALKLFEAFYKEHPRSPMAEAARVEQLRLLLKQKDAHAPEAARAYLDEYPKGFARDEAKSALAP
jgi:ferric-dicitrate binding protein FerR (iron transport regulator)